MFAAPVLFLQVAGAQVEALGKSLAGDGGAGVAERARQVDDDGAELRVAPAEADGVQAVRAAEVEQAVLCRRCLLYTSTTKLPSKASVNALLSTKP